MIFYLTWQEQDPGERILGERILLGVTEDDVRRVFNWKPEELDVGVWPVETLDQVKWLDPIVPELIMARHMFDYFVEVRSE